MILGQRPPMKKYQRPKPILDTKEANEQMIFALTRIKGLLHRVTDSAEKSAVENEIDKIFEVIGYK